MTTGDGIYSAWLTIFSNTSLAYAIKYEVYNVNNSALVDNGNLFEQKLFNNKKNYSTTLI